MLCHVVENAVITTTALGTTLFAKDLADRAYRGVIQSYLVSNILYGHLEHIVIEAYIDSLALGYLKQSLVGYWLPLTRSDSLLLHHSFSESLLSLIGCQFVRLERVLYSGQLLVYKWDQCQG